MQKIITKKKINNYDVISFDVFDTLIERNVDNPTDIFYIVGYKFFNNKEKANQFKNNRIYAESLARRKKLNGEVTINEIYLELDPIYNGLNNKLMNCEIETEIEECRKKDNIFEYYEYALENNKDIYIISDMYLSKKIIEKMIKRCGYEGFKEIIVSNEYGVNKKNGELFKTVIKKYNIDKRKMMHIGDSIKADILGSVKAGISFTWFPKKKMLKRGLHLN